MTRVQESWLRQWGKKGVSLDDTFNSTRYEYKLSTIMVMDNLDRGRPVAFFISKNVDKENISLFFKVYFHFFSTLTYLLSDCEECCPDLRTRICYHRHGTWSVEWLQRCDAELECEKTLLHLAFY